MTPLLLVAKIGLYLLMLASVVAAVGVVTFRNIFHSALALAVTLLGIAGIYVGLGADFIAVVQVLLYVGAVMTLVLFAIMLTHRIGDQTVPQANRQSIPAALTLLVFIGLLGTLFLKTKWPAPAQAVPRIDTLALAQALLGEYVLPFEVVSVVLIAALIGAVVIARKDD